MPQTATRTAYSPTSRFAKWASKPSQFFAATGGLNLKAGSLQIPITDSPSLENVDLSISGAISRRKGWTRYSNALGGAVTGIWQALKSDGTRYLVAHANGQLWKDGGSGTFSSVASGLTAGKPAQFVDWVDKDLCFFVNGADPLKQYDGTTVSSVGGSPPLSAPTAVAIAANRLFNAQGATIAWTDAGTHNVWTGGSSGSGKTPNGEHVRALGSIAGETLVIFTDSGTFKIPPGTPSTWDVIQAGKAGCLGRNAIVDVGRDLMVMSQKGLTTVGNIEMYNDLQPTYLSVKVEPLMHRINFNRFANVSMVHLPTESRVLIAFSEGSDATNRRVVSYHYDLGAFTQHSGVTAESLATAVRPNGERWVLAGDATGYVQRLWSGHNDNAAGILSFYFTGNYDFGDFMRRKRVQYIEVLAGQEGAYNLQMAYAWDLNVSASGSVDIPMALVGASTLWDTAVWDADVWDAAGITRKRAWIKGSGRTLALKFWNIAANQPWTVYGWSPMVEYGGMR